MGSSSFQKSKGCCFLELFHFQFSWRLTEVVYILAA